MESVDDVIVIWTNAIFDYLHVLLDNGYFCIMGNWKPFDCGK